MMQYPQIDPVAISLGPVQVYWYGLMYLIGFALAWWLGVRRAKKAGSGWTEEEVGDLIFYGALGVILGGRLGYVLFYNFSAFMADPLSIIRLNEGGMSFHGGLIGVVVTFFIFARKYKKTFFQISDFIAPMVPLGLATGRIGNFINAELWGKPAEVPWAMVFPTDPLQVPRHPSQLYEFVLEGVVLFVVLWVFSAKPRPAAAVTGLFGLGYGVFRTLVELFFREPDAHIGYLAGDWLTMGVVLSLPMVLIGAAMLWWAYRHADQPPAASAK